MKKFATQFPDQIPPEGLLLSFRWGKANAKGNIYTKLTLLQSGEVQLKTASRNFQEGLAKELDLRFIPERIWKELAGEKFSAKISEMKAV